MTTYKAIKKGLSRVITAFRIHGRYISSNYFETVPGTSKYDTELYSEGAKVKYELSTSQAQEIEILFQDFESQFESIYCSTFWLLLNGGLQESNTTPWHKAALDRLNW